MKLFKMPRLEMRRWVTVTSGHRTMAGFGNYCLKTSASILTLAVAILHQFQKFKSLVKGPQFCECWKLKFLTLE